MAHRQLVRRLVAALREARSDALEWRQRVQALREESGEWAAVYESRLETAERKLQNARDQARRDREDREQQDWDRERLHQDLERARERGDTYDEDRILSKLKHL